VQALAVETKRDILTFGTFTQNNVIVSVKTLLSELGDTRHHSIHVTCQDNSTTSKQLTPKSTPSSKGLQTDIRAIYEEAKRCGIKLLDVEDDLDNPIHDTSNSRPARFGPERTGFNKHVQRQFFDSAINNKKTKQAPLDIRLTWGKYELKDIAQALSNVQFCKLNLIVFYC
jgi:hypothetical protein